MLPKRWVLLRGLAREKRHWGPFTEFFKEQLGGVEAEAIDLPGIGEFAGESAQWSIQATTKFVREKARARFPEGRFSLLAVSLGGMVAMQWLQDYETDLEAAVLINSSSKDSRFYHRLRYQIWSDFFQIAAAVSPREREKLIIDLIINSEVSREQALACWSKIAVENPMRPITFARQLFAASQFRGLQKKPSVPVLLLNSLGDRLVDPRCSEALHKKLGWKLERHPWAGHDLAWDDPQWVTDYIVRFFS